MGSEELAANWFRVTQAEAQLKKDNEYGKQHANKTHFEVLFFRQKAFCIDAF